MSDDELLVDDLERIARLAVNDHGAETIIVGGGPLAAAAGVLRDRLTVRMVEPIAGGDAKDDCWLAAMAMKECPTAGVGAENTGHDVSHVMH
jgi:Asp/Glu/hydantoin racemase